MSGRPVIALCVGLLFAGCGKEQWDDCITSTGPMHNELRHVGDLHTIDLDDRVDVVLEPRDHGTVVVEAGRNLLDQVSTEVENGVLRIRNENRCNWVRSFKPRITVHVPIDQVATLLLRGTGNVTGNGTIERERFTIEQHGAQGSCDLTLDVQRVDVALHTGAGDVTLHGRCTGVANLYNGIMGPIDASDMIARFVNINNSGVTDIRCAVDDWLDVQIHDAGDVYYRGDPNGIGSVLTGTGRLIRLD